MQDRLLRPLGAEAAGFGEGHSLRVPVSAEPAG